MSTADETAVERADVGPSDHRERLDRALDRVRSAPRDVGIRWVNSDVGRALRLRGLNARVLRNGEIEVGDAVVVRRP